MNSRSKIREALEDADRRRKKGNKALLSTGFAVVVILVALAVYSSV